MAFRFIETLPNLKMSRSSRIVQFFWIVTCVFFFHGANLNAGDLGDEGLEKRKAAILNMNRNIQLYGMVLDQHGQPVKDAEVLISWEKYTIPFPGPMKERWIRTGENGNWEFSVKAGRVMVDEARSPGYLFSREQQDYGGFSSDDLKNNRTSPSARIILRLHKLAEPLFLLTDAADLVRPGNDGSHARQFDIYRRKTMASAEAKNQSSTTFYPDLEFQIEQLGSTGLWRVTYRAPRDGDGLISSGRLMFEAPITGYQKEVVLQGIYDQDFPSYLYLKSRVPAVFSRLELVVKTRPDSCALYYELSSNPYGTRSLEPNAELEPLWQLRELLTKQARTEVAAGRLLDKKVLSGMIKAASMNRGN